MDTLAYIIFVTNYSAARAGALQWQKTKKI